ncbi:unnamed protein product, partial [Mesorhabditis belari]|uniref:protein xylosyltransferase n=1 Tax=Mesorhabditis belari TaxID=2138241 RepID=A0AAF3EW24_9BILA
MLGTPVLLRWAMKTRGPMGKTLRIVLGSLVFFFINLSIIYYYVQIEKPSDQSVIQERANEKLHEQLQCVLDGSNELAKSALNRAACRLQNGSFHETMPLSGCHNYDTSLAGVSMGCFYDQSSNRQLKGHQYDFADNTRDKCESHCYRAGFLYYGVEYGKECFCGDDFDAQYIIERSKCKEYNCTGDDSQKCGGFDAIDIYRTGLIIKAAQLTRRPLYLEVERLKEKPTKARILFVLQLNGRNIRQVQRLLKSIYSPNHFYYIHVDKRQIYMLSKMRDLAARLANLYVEPEGRSTIWGGASLLDMITDAIRTTINIPNFSSWDYLVNLSESDFPVMSLAELETQLTLNNGRSFLASHGYNTARFIQKQGFDYVFVECEERMWRVGKRNEFPRGLRIDGGSDWVILHKDFAKYSISNEELPQKLRTLFSSIILPVESFYHTLAANSMYCDHVVTGNLRLTNWNRKQGCRCASLKKVVDWCGCSPLVFTKDTIHKFELEKAKEKVYYLARKFENLIDVDAIAAAEAQAMRDRSHLLNTNSKAFNTSHVNLYEAGFDGYSESYTLLTQRLFSMAKLGSLSFGSLRSIHVYREHFEANWQLVFTVLTTHGQTIELLAQRIHDTLIEEQPIVNGYILRSIRIGVSIDHKEEIFRGYTGYVDQTGSPTILLQWERMSDLPTSIPENKTSPAIQIIWKDQTGHNKLEFGLLQLLMVVERLGEFDSPLFDSSVKEDFFQMVAKFYRLVASCSSPVECSGSLWSTYYPDPKSDILVGYDERLGYLV